MESQPQNDSRCPKGKLRSQLFWTWICHFFGVPNQFRRCIYCNNFPFEKGYVKKVVWGWFVDPTFGSIQIAGDNLILGTKGLIGCSMTKNLWLIMADLLQGLRASCDRNRPLAATCPAQLLKGGPFNNIRLMNPGLVGLGWNMSSGCVSSTMFYPYWLMIMSWDYPINLGFESSKNAESGS